MAESSIYFLLCTRDRKSLNKIIECEGQNDKNLYQKSSGLKKVTYIMGKQDQFIKINIRL